MLALTLIIRIFLGATLSGAAIVAALVLGYHTLTPILIAAAIGFLAAFPVSYAVAKALHTPKT